MEHALPTGRPGRLLALAISIALLLVIWLGLVAPIAGLFAERAERLHHDAAVLDRMEQIAASLPSLRDRVAKMRESGEQTVFTIPGATDAVAAATLQNMLQDMAAGVNANVASFETVPGQTVGAYRRIGITLSLHEPWTAIVALLKGIETARVPMLVDDIEIHALPMGNTTKGQRLETSFTIYAFRSAAGGDSR